MNRREQILKMAEFDEGLAIKHGWDINCEGEQQQSEWIYGRCLDSIKDQNARLMPLITALAERIQELEGVMQKILDKEKPWQDAGHQCLSKFDLQSAYDRARQALSNTSALDALLASDK